MPNAVLTILILLAAPLFLASNIGLYQWAKRGAHYTRIWLAWAVLVLVTIILLFVAVLSNLDSGPAELLAVTACVSSVAFILAIPRLKKRVETSEMNRVISRDL